MKLKIYNEKNTKCLRVTEPSINVQKTGMIALNGRICEIMEIQPGDRVNIIYNEEENEWYVCKTSDINGFKVRKSTTAKTRALSFNNSYLANKILNSYGNSNGAPSVSYLVAREPVHHQGMKLHCILASTGKSYMKTKRYD